MAFFRFLPLKAAQLKSEGQMKDIVINGQFFIQDETGQQRYAKGILLELDNIIQKGEITIVAPRCAKNVPQYKNINIVYTGNINNRLWEQICLAYYLLKEHKIPVNFCNTAPLLKKGITVIHDIATITHKEFFNTRKGKIARIYYSFIQASVIKSGNPVITVSGYSKRTIMEKFNISDDKIMVIPNAWQHFEKIIEDNSVFTRHGNIIKGNYFFSLGSLQKQKNYDWIHLNAEYNTKETYVIAGKTIKSYVYEKKKINPPNIIYLGYLTDGEIKSLIKSCKAFLFPSLFEGFGIPPLEALSLGVPIIISNIPSLSEIFEDSASYIDPRNPMININEKIKNIPDSKRCQILSKYSWRKSALLFYDFLKNYME
jgi:glycosyltransferase involved in cell wall biosynthesis